LAEGRRERVREGGGATCPNAIRLHFTHQKRTSTFPLPFRKKKKETTLSSAQTQNLHRTLFPTPTRREKRGPSPQKETKIQQWSWRNEGWDQGKTIFGTGGRDKEKKKRGLKWMSNDKSRESQQEKKGRRGRTVEHLVGQLPLFFLLAEGEGEEGKGTFTPLPIA